MTEAVIATTPARMLEGDLDGTLTLTTERLLFVVGETTPWQVRRDQIAYANQLTTRGELWVFVRGRGRGDGFAVRSPFAGPVPWRWYLDPPRAPWQGDPLDARADDDRLGAVDERKQPMLADWRARIGFTTVSPIEHYLDDLPVQPVRWETIVEIVYVVDGKGDGPSWLLVVRLADGRWVYFAHQVDITGEVYSTTIVASSLESLWWGAMTEDDRDRVTAQMTPERLDEELVRLDHILGSTAGLPVAHAERRMLAIKRRR